MSDPEKPEGMPASDMSKQEVGGYAEGSALGETVLIQNDLHLFPEPVNGDALDPLNWPKLQKHVILAIVMALYFMFTYITAMTVPSFPTLQEKFRINLDQANWTVAIPALGLSLGPLMWASPADIIGRRPIFIAGTIMAFAATIGAALAPTYSLYMAARFFQGFGVSPASNVGLAILNDLFFEHERGQKVGLWVLAIDLGLLFGPLFGGFISLAGHNWVQWVSAILFGVILLSEVFFLPETLYPRSFMHAQTNGSLSNGEGTNEKGQTTVEPTQPHFVPRTRELPIWKIAPVPGVRHPRSYDTILRFLKTFRFLVVSIPVMAYCFGWYWWVLSVVTMIPIAYPTYSPQSQGLLYIGLIVGTLISEVVCSGTLSDLLVVWLARRNGNKKVPEMRLWLAYPAAVLTTVGLIVWGISVDRNYHWMVGQVALALFGAGIQMGNTAVCAYIFESYPLQSMSTITFYSVMLNLSAFVDPFFIVPWVDSVGFTWTFAGHAIITFFFCVPVIAGLHFYGKELREWSGAPEWVNPEFESNTV